MVTTTRAQGPRTRTRRRRNRKRTGPIWRQLPDLRALAFALGRAVRHAVPGLIAITVIAGVCTGAYFGYQFVTTSERFAVAAIEIRGHKTLSDERISTILGVAPGVNIFDVDVDQLADRLEAEPVIARASVSRRLPDTLLVDIVEHTPAALVDLGGPYLSDATGHVYQRASITRGDGAGLPIVTGIPRSAYVADPQSVAGDIERALRAFELYRETDDRPALSDINLHPRQGITFITYDSAMQIRVGDGDAETLRANLRTFDTAWNALTARERERVRVVYADTTNRTDRVTVGFEHLER